MRLSLIAQFVFLLYTEGRLAFGSPSIAQSVFEETRRKKCVGVTPMEIQRLGGDCFDFSGKPYLQDLDLLAEFLVFEPIAQLEKARIACTIDQTSLLKKNHKIREDAIASACNRLPDIKRVRDDIRDINRELNSFSKNDAVSEACELRGRPRQDCIVGKSNKEQSHIAALKVILAMKTNEERLLRITNPLLSSPTVYEEVSRSLTPGIVIWEPSAEKTCLLLRKSAQSWVAKDLEVLKQSSRVLNSKLEQPNWISDQSLKESLWNSGSKDIRLASTQHKGLSESTYCRLEGRYGEGAKLVDRLGSLAINGTLLILPFVGELALGITSFRVGAGAINSIRRTEAMAMAARASLGFELGANAILTTTELMNSCGEKMSALSSTRKCGANTPNEVEAQYFRIKEANSCFFSIGMSLLSGGASVALTKLGHARPREAADRYLSEKISQFFPRKPATPSTLALLNYKGPEVLSAKRFFSKVDHGANVRVYFKDGREQTGTLISDKKDQLVIRHDGKDQVIKKDENFLNFGISTPEDIAVRSFVRYDNGIAEVKNSAYLSNLAASKRAAAKHMDNFAENDSKDLFFSNLRERHRVAAGEEGRLSYGGRYNAPRQTVSPGVFRDESPLFRAIDEEYGSLFNRINIKGEGTKFEEVGILSKIEPEVRGYDAAISPAIKDGRLKQPNRAFPSNNITSDFPHAYPASETMPYWRGLIYDRYKEALLAIGEAKSTDNLLGALNSVADYYHTAINSHLFGRINNSLFMNDVNLMLSRLGLQEVPHGSLDGYAAYFDYEDFRRVFVTYVRDKTQ